MKILAKGTMPNGTPIQIEDWSEDYSFMPYGSTLASYPKSKVSHEGGFAPKGNEPYRFAFDFGWHEEAQKAFDGLLNGSRCLADFKQHLERKEYADCI